MQNFFQSLQGFDLKALAALCLVSGFFFIFLYQKITQGWIKRRNRKRISRASKGEKKAKLLLQRLGFEILEEQAPLEWHMFINGSKIPVLLRADFLVRKKRKVFVVEVKTGKAAPSPTHTDTRRQLLEYSLAYKDAGVLLLDMEQGKLSEIQFPNSKKPSLSPHVVWLLLGTSIVVILLLAQSSYE